MTCLKPLGLMIVAAILQGCMANTDLKPAYPPLLIDKVANETHTASVGDVIYVEREPSMIAGAILEGSMDTWRYKVPTGTQVYARNMAVDDSLLYCTTDMVVKNALGMDAGRACFRDIDNDGAFETVEVLLEAGDEFTVTQETIEPLSYRFGEFPSGNPDLDYTVTFVGEIDSALRFDVAFQRSDSGCQIKEGSATLGLTTGFPATAVLPSLPELESSDPQVEYVARSQTRNIGDRGWLVKTLKIPGKPRENLSARDQEFLTDFWNEIADQLAHQLTVLSWENNTLTYQLVLKPRVWRYQNGMLEYQVMPLNTQEWRYTETLGLDACGGDVAAN